MFIFLFCFTVSLFLLIEDGVEIIVEDFVGDFRNFDDDFSWNLLVLAFQEILKFTRK